MLREADRRGTDPHMAERPQRCGQPLILLRMAGGGVVILTGPAIANPVTVYASDCVVCDDGIWIDWLGTNVSFCTWTQPPDVQLAQSKRQTVLLRRTPLVERSHAIE